MEGKTGRLIPPGDAERMRAAVEAALASPATLQQWSTAARRHVEERFRIEDEAAALNALYRELLDGGEDGQTVHDHRDGAWLGNEFGE